MGKTYQKYDFTALETEVTTRTAGKVTMRGTCKCTAVFETTTSFGIKRARTSIARKYRNHIEAGTDRLCPYGKQI